MASDAGQGITQAGLLAVIWVFVTLSTLLLAGRLLIRSILLKSFNSDDAFGALSWFFMLVCMICATVELPLSYHFTSIIIGETPMPSPDELADLTITSRRWTVADQTFFWTSLFCVKFSFMFLYKMVLGSHSKYRTAWYFGIAYITASYGICLIGVFGQCGDAQNLFKYEECMTPYVALLDSRVIWVVWFFNVSSDLIVILLPMPVIWNLNMRFKQKLAVSSICGLAGITIAFETVRSVKLYQTNFNLTNLYSYLELLITVVIGMLPSYRFMVGNTDKDREYRHLFWTHVTFRSRGSSQHSGYSMHSYDRSRNTESARNINETATDVEQPSLPPAHVKG
ncbi:hypothetical protein SUNI508_07815 [Seiridium unicorne]|uniref:Rhodopsin domain-containing protein n=1 Tax=Seiridium unicorne TaxID=138068 RepID=A0ABR2UVV3_9PEZI